MNIKKIKAFEAWNTGKCSDEQLLTCIESLRDLIDTMDACGCRGIMLTGFYTTLHSMETAMASRERDRS